MNERSWFCLAPLALVALQAGCDGTRSASTLEESTTPPVREGYVDAGAEVELFFRVVGDGADTVIVLHGGPGFSMDYFAEDLEPLAARLTLVLYDQRGAGRSTLVNDSAGLAGPRFAEDLEAVRNHFGLQGVTLLGHSWGAAVAALYASAYPERVERMLIVGGVPLQRAPLLRAFEELAANRDSTTQRLMEQRFEAWLADPGDATACRAYYALWFGPFFGDSAASGRSRGDFCAGSPAALRNKVSSVDVYTFPSLGDWDWRPAMRELSAPTLLIHGTADPLPLEGARTWAALMPDARLMVLDGIGHFPYLEAPDAFFPAVERFVRGEWPEEARAVTGS